jgi:hypothetical protein
MTRLSFMSEFVTESSGLPFNNGTLKTTWLFTFSRDRKKVKGIVKGPHVENGSNPQYCRSASKPTTTVHLSHTQHSAENLFRQLLTGGL